jgi:hypothetical protein
VLERYREIASSGDSWREIEGRVIDRYEAAHARVTLDYAALCAARDKEKAEAVARVKASQAAQK